MLVRHQRTPNSMWMAATATRTRQTFALTFCKSPVEESKKKRRARKQHSRHIWQVLCHLGRLRKLRGREQTSVWEQVPGTVIWSFHGNIALRSMYDVAKKQVKVGHIVHGTLYIRARQLEFTCV